MPTKSTIREFVPERDEDVLWHWARALTHSRLTNPTAIERALDVWADKSNWPGPRVSRGWVRRFLIQESVSRPRDFPERMRTLWCYLASEPRYAHHFRERDVITAKQPPTAAHPEPLLAFALANFLPEGNGIKHIHDFAQMTRRLPGTYVMYRRDHEPAASEWSPDREPTLRVSRIEITASDECLFIKETQEFPPSDNRPRHYQYPSGVIVSFGQYMIGIMAAEESVAFKCLAIKEMMPKHEESPIEDFRGQLFVASSVALFPSMKFVCRRSEGKKEKHGIYRFEEVDRDIVAFITSPIFPGHQLTV